MTALLTCRPRTAADLGGCVALLETVFAADAYPEVWPDDPPAWLNFPSTVAAWIVRRESLVVGHVAIGRVDGARRTDYSAATGHATAQLAEIKRFFVHPRMRGAQIANSLHDASIAFARARGLHPVLETVAENERAIRFYERRGWQRIGTAIADWHTAAGDRPTMVLFELPSKTRLWGTFS